MNSNLIAGLAIYFAGVMIPLAIAFNARIGNVLGNPILGAAAVPIVGLVFMAVVLMFLRPNLPALETLNEVPWYAWLGGAMVTLYFIILILNAPKIGFGFAVSLVVAGQLTSSSFIDHFGLFGLPVIPFSLGRMTGAILIVIGVALLKYF